MKVEVLSGPERHRRWSVEEKARIVGETMAAGIQVSEVARRHGVSDLSPNSLIQLRVESVRE